MDYDDHFARYKESEVRKGKFLQDQEDARLAALKYNLGECARLISEIIHPELIKLESAMNAAGYSCRVLKSSKRFEKIEVEFEASIEISSTDSGRTFWLKFSADPVHSFFAVEDHLSEKKEEVPFHKVTPASARAVCERFVKETFPV